jgi:hypothetical protein
METTRKLNWLVGILAVLNLALVGSLAWPYLQRLGPAGPPDANLNREADVFMERQIGLSRDQVERFEKARWSNRAEFDGLRDQMRNIRKRLTMSIFGSAADASDPERMLDDLASCSRRMEALTFQHLKDVQGFCNQEQMVRFKALLEEVFRQPLPPPPQPRTP